MEFDTYIPLDLVIKRTPYSLPTDKLLANEIGFICSVVSYGETAPT